MKQVALLLLVVIPWGSELHSSLSPIPVEKTKSEAPTPYRETIVVTAERIDVPQQDSVAAVTVLTRADLERLPVETLADALRFVPGLQLTNITPGAPPMISSRGFFGAGEVEYVQLLVDGVPAGDIESGLADWRAIPVHEIERVEILRGPGSSLYGDTALGGVVSVTRLRRARSVSGSVGNFGSRMVEASIPAAAVRWQTSNGFREHSQSEELFATARLERGRLRATFDFSDRQRDEPGSRDASELRSDRYGSHPFFQFDGDSSQRLRASLHYSTPSTMLAVHGATRRSEAVRTLLLAPSFPDRATRFLDTRRIGFEARTQRTGLAYGVEAFRDEVGSTYRPFDEQRGYRHRAAAYVSAGVRLSPRTRLSGALRWDGIDDHFAGEAARDQAISPRLGVSTQWGTTSIYLQGSRAFKAPTLDQRFDQRPFPDFAGGTFTISNPRINPQRAKNLEAGVRRSVDESQWEIVAYSMHVDDEIDFDPATFRYANIGRSIHRGIEAGAQWRWASMFPTVAYTWTRVAPREGENRRKQLKNIAEHLVRATLSLPVAGGVATTFSVEHTAGRYLDDANHFPLDDSTVADVRLTRTIGRARLSLNALNITDARFAPLGYALADFSGAPQPFYFPAPGRSIEIGVVWILENGDQP